MEESSFSPEQCSKALSIDDSFRHSINLYLWGHCIIMIVMDSFLCDDYISRRGFHDNIAYIMTVSGIQFLTRQFPDLPKRTCDLAVDDLLWVIHLQRASYVKVIVILEWMDYGYFNIFKGDTPR